MSTTSRSKPVERRGVARPSSVHHDATRRTGLRAGPSIARTEEIAERDGEYPGFQTPNIRSNIHWESRAMVSCQNKTGPVLDSLSFVLVDLSLVGRSRDHDAARRLGGVSPMAGVGAYTRFTPFPRLSGQTELKQKGGKQSTNILL